MMDFFATTFLLDRRTERPVTWETHTPRPRPVPRPPQPPRPALTVVEHR